MAWPHSTERWALVGGTAVLPDRLLDDCCIEIESGRIVRVGATPKRMAKETRIIDLDGGYVAPGFVDLHVHGGAGADFMDGTCEAVAVAAHSHLMHGTTSICPTTTTGSEARIHQLLKALDTLATQPRDDLPHIEGVHLYGPYFVPEKAGCHARSGCRTPKREEFEGYFRTKQIRIATCAAELEGAIEFYRYARRRGCLVTCGHSNASWTEMAAAHRAGMSHVDHFWCAMSSVASVRGRLGTPMQGSMLEFVLGHGSMSTEIIADGSHLAPELLQFAWQMKGPTMLCLVTDANRAMDMPPGRYAFGHPDEGVEIVSDGVVGRSPDGGLASAIQGMDHAVQHLAKRTHIPLQDIIRMASLTPAERIGIDARVGSIAVGKQADLLVMNKKLTIKKIYKGR